MGGEGAGVGALMRALHEPRDRGLAEHLAARCDVEVLAVTVLDAGVYRVDRADGPPWVARVFPAERPSERVEGDAAVLAHLADAGIPAERPARPDPVSSLDDRPVLVTTFVAGDAPHHVPGYEGLPREDLALAAALLDDARPAAPAGSRAPLDRLRDDVAGADDCGDLPAALGHPDR